MQPLAGLEIELVDCSRDGGRGGRAQSLSHGPKGLFFVRRLDQNQAGRIEPEAIEAMAVRMAVLSKTASRHRQQQRRIPRHAAKQRREESEGGRHVAISFGRNLVQGPEGEPALRQMGIKGRKAEGEDARLRRKALHPGQQAA